MYLLTVYEYYDSFRVSLIDHIRLNNKILYVTDVNSMKIYIPKNTKTNYVFNEYRAYKILDICVDYLVCSYKNLSSDYICDLSCPRYVAWSLFTSFSVLKDLKIGIGIYSETNVYLRELEGFTRSMKAYNPIPQNYSIEKGCTKTKVTMV